jgi:hypothetical protein
MHFAARYTRYSIMPYEHQRGMAPTGYHLQVTVLLTLEHDVTGRTGTTVLTPLITRALNQHAGGRRLFGSTPVFVEWLVAWSPLRVESGRVLGVAIVDDYVVDSLERPGHPPAAVTLLSVGGAREWGRMIFRASLFESSHGHARLATRSERTQSTIAHEAGHATGQRDQRTDPASTMFYRQLTDREYRRLDQRWSDMELRIALQNIFSGPDRRRPAWLQ